MSSVNQAPHTRRVLFSASLAGAGLGLALGAVYMAGGMADAIAAHRHTEQMAAAVTAGYANGVAGFHNEVAAVAVPRANVARLDIAPRVRSTPRELDCLTQAVYFEARGETAEGQAAVAQVVLNRVRHPAFPKTVCAVVYQGCQFSFACDGSTQRAHETGAWGRARKIAVRALAGTAVVEVGSATHFHTVRVNPGWGPNLLRVSQVGLHVFYQLSNRPVRWTPKAAPAHEQAEAAVFVSAPIKSQVVTLDLTAAMPAPLAADKAPAAEVVKTDAVATAVAPALTPVAAKAPLSKAAGPKVSEAAGLQVAAAS